MSHSSRRDEWKRHTGMVKMLGPKLRELNLHRQRKRDHAGSRNFGPAFSTITVNAVFTETLKFMTLS